MKALSDVTYRIEEERRKVGERRNRKVVHFNYLKPCFTPPPVHEKPPPATTSGEAARSKSRDVLQPTQAGADNTGGVVLEWLENPVVLSTEGHQTPQVQGASATLGPDAQPRKYLISGRFLLRTMNQVKFQLDRDVNEGSHRGSRTMLGQLLFTLRGLLLLLEQLLINFLLT